jgi:hypothetical protein
MERDLDESCMSKVHLKSKMDPPAMALFQGTHTSWYVQYQLGAKKRRYNIMYSAVKAESGCQQREKEASLLSFCARAALLHGSKNYIYRIIKYSLACVLKPLGCVECQCIFYDVKRLETEMERSGVSLPPSFA